MSNSHRLTGHPNPNAVAFATALLAIVVLVGALSLASRARFVEEAKSNTQNMAEIISDDVEQTISKTHSDIRSFEKFVKTEDLTAAVSASRRMEIESLLASHLTNFPQITNYRIFTASGDTLFGSGKNPAIFNVGDRQWFGSLRDDHTRQLTISEVVIGKGTKAQIGRASCRERVSSPV